MKNLLIGCSIVCLISAATHVQASVITDATRLVGVTFGQPEIVYGPNPGGLQDGSSAFMDRPVNPSDIRDYHWQDIPAELLGADYVKTYNEDKDPQYPNAYGVSYSVTLNQAARLYIFIDRRYVDAHGDPPFAWLVDGSSGTVFTDTGLEITLNEAGGRNVLQPFNVYVAEVSAGTYFLGATCDGDASRNFYSFAATRIQATVIADAIRLVGVTFGQPEIISGPSPGGLQEGSSAFMDRPVNPSDVRDYHWQDIPMELLGADYVKTYNEDKSPQYSNVYNVSYSVTLGQAARLYIFIDRRYVDAHGNPPFAWLTDGSNGAVFRDTGLEITLDEAGGRNVLQPFNVYVAEVSAGTYIFREACDGNAERNFYAFAATRVQPVVIADATRLVGVTFGQPEIVYGPSPGGLREGSNAFMDRPVNLSDIRDYRWQDIPAELLGADYVKTYNEDKAPQYANAYRVSYSVTLGQAARLYIFIDRRYVDALGDPPFTWLADGSSGAVFRDTGFEITLDEVGGRNVLQPFNVYMAAVSAGTYILGATCDGNASRNFYAIAAVAVSKIENFETGDFSRFDWKHSGDARWKITSGERHSGNYSARAGNLGDNGKSVMRLVRECSGGNIRFHFKVSSETDYDYLSFSIDGRKLAEWSGEQDWTQVSFQALAGRRTFGWTYSKDGSTSEGDDTAWIDDIIFP